MAGKLNLSIPPEKEEIKKYSLPILYYAQNGNSCYDAFRQGYLNLGRSRIVV